MISLKTHFTNTYAKTLISDWPIMANLIEQKTAWLKESLQPNNKITSSLSTMLSDQNISDAYNGPFQNFFKPCLSAYAHIATLETAIHISKEEFFKEAEFEVDSTLGIPEKLLAQTELSTLKEVRTKLDTVVTENSLQWDSVIQGWTEKLLQEMKKNNLLLSEPEIQEFSTHQPVSELDDRFINMKIAAPKLPKDTFNFQQYFILKIVLAAHSALSRTQQPHTEKEIEQVIKIMQTPLQTIALAEKEMTQDQQKTIQELMTNIMWTTG